MYTDVVFWKSEERKSKRKWDRDGRGETTRESQGQTDRQKNRESDIEDLYSIRDYRVGKHKSIQVPERSFSDEMEQTPTKTESK